MTTRVELYRSDPATWAEDHFWVDRQWTGKGWSMKPGPVRLAEYQKEVFREALSGRYSIVVWSEPAKSGKSTIAAAAATWVALHKARAECYVIANDLGGTGRVYGAAEYAVKKNPHLHPRTIKNELHFKDGYIKAIPADYRGESGADPSLTVFDEVEHFMYSHQSRLVGEFKVSPTRDFSMQWFTGYGGWEGESELWAELLARKEGARPVLTHLVNSDGLPACWDCGSTFVFYSDVLRQPWQTAKWVQTQEQNLTPSDFKRIILNQFVPISSQVFVQPEWWKACLDPTVKPIVSGDKTPVILSLDLAKGTAGGDNIALTAICKWGSDGYGVKYARAWEPDNGRFDYDTTVIPELWRLIEMGNVAQLCFDEYEATYLVKQFQDKVWCKPFSQAGERELSDRFLYDAIASRKVHHFDDATLNAHVYAAGANVKGENRMRIVKAGRKKIDLCVSLSMGVYRVNSLALPPDPASLSIPAQVRPAPQQQPAAPTVPALPANGTVQVLYQGLQADGSFELHGQKVYQDQPLTLSLEQFQRLQNASPPGWWKKIN